MKKCLLLFFIFKLTNFYSQFSPACSNVFYLDEGSYASSIYSINAGIPSTVGIVPLSNPSGTVFGSSGLAIGSPFGFTAPNPTFWTSTSLRNNFTTSNIQYYDGTGFVNSGHTIPGSGFALGSSKNFLYLLNESSGAIYKYNGTASPTLVTTVTQAVYGDITCDDQDNFYLLKTSNPAALNIFNSAGSMVCSYPVTGLPGSTIPPNHIGEAVSITGNTICVGSDITAEDYYVGLVTPTGINFTLTPKAYNFATDFASCYLVSTFSSTITANASPTLNCAQTITLSASAAIAPVNYTWTGPGFISPQNNADAEVVFPGVYTCSMSTTDCPPKTSVATFTVFNGGGFVTPTVTSSGSLSCTNPTAQLSVLPDAGPNTFLWSGSGINGANNTPTIDLGAAGIYSVTVTNTLNSCSVTRTISVVSGIAPLNIGISASGSLVCFPSGSATLTASGAASFSWSPASSLNAATGASVIASPSIATIYTVSGQTGVCSGSKTISITAFITPTLITASNPSVCRGFSTALTVSGASSYTWMPGSINATSITTSPTTTAVYTITGKNGGCPAATTITLTALPNPTVYFSSVTPNSICPGQSATLTVTGAQNYTWQPGNYTGTSNVVTPTISTTYTIFGQAANGCSSKVSQFYGVGYTPTLTLLPSSQTICAGTALTLTCNSIGSVWAFTWTPVSSQDYTISVTPTVNTTYSVIAAGQCASSASVAVTVIPSPTTTAVFSGTSICSGSQVTITPGGASSYTLNPGGLTSVPFVVTPLSTTLYTLAGHSGACTNSINKTVSVTTTPTLTAANNVTTVCSGNPVTLFAGGATNYTWTPGNSNGNNMYVTPLTSTTYTVAGANGTCMDTKTLSLNVMPLPAVAAVISSPTLCAGSTLTASASGAIGYYWLPVNLTNTTITDTPGTSMSYSVSGIAANGCTNTAVVNVTVLPAPLLSISASHYSICSGNSVTLSASGAATYSWLPVIALTSTLSASPHVTTTYTVTGASSDGCTSTAVSLITVAPSPSLTLLSNPLAICAGDHATLTATGALTYTWDPPTLSGAQVVVSPQANTTYTITGQSGNCTGVQTLALNVGALPALTIQSTKPVLCIGESATLTAGGAATYSWNTTANTLAIVVSPVTPTSYTLIGTAQNSCTNSLVIFQDVSECLGITEIESSQNSILLYPNPAASWTKVVSQLPGVLVIYNVAGKVILEQHIAGSGQALNLEMFTPGIYFYRFVTSSSKTSGKLIVE